MHSSQSSAGVLVHAHLSDFIHSPTHSLSILAPASMSSLLAPQDVNQTKYPFFGGGGLWHMHRNTGDIMSQYTHLHAVKGISYEKLHFL